MGRYQFEGKFRDVGWSELPSPDDVKASITRALATSSSSKGDVFGVRIGRIEVTDVAASLPMFEGAGLPEADVVVTWETTDVVEIVHDR